MYHASAVWASSRPALVSLQNAQIPHLQGVVSPSSPCIQKGNALTWKVNDEGAIECWAIIAPSAETGGQVRAALLNILLGRVRPRRAEKPEQRHDTVHPFLTQLSQTESTTHRPIAHVAFETRTGGNGAFVDFSVRYGSIRDQDRVTLWEHLMESCGVYTGAIARQHMRPDPLAPVDTDTTGLLKWESKALENKKRAEAEQVRDRIMAMAPSLSLDSLLDRPVVALSNGQTRRARILRALLGGAEFVVMDEPFTGLDVPTRASLSQLLGTLHARRRPRLCVFLREQDTVPSFVTHILRVDEDGYITQLGDKTKTTPLLTSASSTTRYALGGYDLVKENHARGLGVGQTAAETIVSMHNVSIEYGGVPVLRNVTLALHPGTRMVLMGDNGSGKTTLLSLLLGDNPRSFALPASMLRMWGAARDAPSNAHVLLQRRIGHLSPELFNVFPRQHLDAGGLSVADAIASGFHGIFTKRSRTPAQEARVLSLVRMFAQELWQEGPAGGNAMPRAHDIAEMAFTSLPHGAQALVLLLRAMVHRPALLVLDEPFQGMSAQQCAKARAFLDAQSPNDAMSTSWLWDELANEEERAAEQAWRERMAMVVVSHYETEWPRSCGRFLRLSQGHVTEQW